MDGAITWGTLVQAVMTILAIAGAGGGLWMALQRQINGLNESLAAHKLYAAETYLRQGARDEIIRAMSEQEGKLLEAIREMRAEQHALKTSIDALAQAVARLSGRLDGKTASA